MTGDVARSLAQQEEYRVRDTEPEPQTEYQRGYLAGWTQSRIEAEAALLARRAPGDRDAILEAALRHFGSHGWVPLSVDQTTGYETGNYRCIGDPCRCGFEAALRADSRPESDDDLRAAVEIMATKVTPYGERADGTTAAYIVADSTWHRVLAIARGSTSDAARKAIDSFRADSRPEPQK